MKSASRSTSTVATPSVLVFSNTALFHADTLAPIRTKQHNYLPSCLRNGLLTQGGLGHWIMTLFLMTVCSWSMSIWPDKALCYSGRHYKASLADVELTSNLFVVGIMDAFPVSLIFFLP